MSLFNPPDAIELTDDLIEELRLNNPEGGQLLEIKPYKESERGMADNIEMYKAFHNRSEWHGFNNSPTNSFEIWFDGDNVRFLMYVADESQLHRAVNHITSNFPSARITFPQESYDDIMLPNIGKYGYVSGAHFNLAMHFFAPIRNPDGVNKFYGQYRNIIADMANSEEVTEIIQVLFKPAGTGWTSSHWNDAAEFAKDISEGPPGELSEAARNIKTQIGQQGFYIALRVLCLGDDREEVIKQRNDIGMAFNQYYREYTGQTFVPDPQSGTDINRLCSEVVRREGRHMDWPGVKHLRRMRAGKSCQTSIMTIPELAGLAHIPNDDHVDSSAIDWVMLDSSNRLPAQAPKYEDNKRPVNENEVPWATHTVGNADDKSDTTPSEEPPEPTPSASTDTSGTSTGGDTESNADPEPDDAQPTDPQLPDTDDPTNPQLPTGESDDHDESEESDDNEDETPTDRWGGVSTGSDNTE